MDWATILAGLGGGEGASPLPLDVNQPTVYPPPDFAGPGQVGAQPHDFNAPPTTLPQPQMTGTDVPRLPVQGDPTVQSLEPGKSRPATTGAAQSATGAGMRQGRQGERTMDEYPAGSVGAALRGGAAGPTSLGGPGGPTPLGGGATGPITLGGPSGPTPFGAASAAPGTPADNARKAAGLAAALKGVAAPAAPVPQKVSTPNAPRPTGTIKGGDLQALLLALNAGGVGAPGARPATLGQTIGR